MKLVNAGFGNWIASDRVISLMSSDSAPAKRMVSAAKKDGRAIDITGGKKTRSVVVTDCGYIVLSSVQTDTLAHRIEDAIEKNG